MLIIPVSNFSPGIFPEPFTVTYDTGSVYARAWNTPSACNVWHVPGFPRSWGLSPVTDGPIPEDTRIRTYWFSSALYSICQWLGNLELKVQRCGLCIAVSCPAWGSSKIKGHFYFSIPPQPFGAGRKAKRLLCEFHSPGCWWKLSWLLAVWPWRCGLKQFMLESASKELLKCPYQLSLWKYMTR